MELSLKTKKIIAICTGSVLAIVVIIMLFSSPSKKNTFSSFIVNEKDSVDLSVYQPKVHLDRNGRIKTNLDNSIFDSNNTSDWQEFINSEDIPTIPELPVYVIDKTGKKILVDGPQSKKQAPSKDPTADYEDNEGIKYYTPKGIKTNYNNTSPSKNSNITTPVENNNNSVELSDKERRRQMIEGRYEKGGGSLDYEISCVVHTTQIVKSEQTIKLRVTKSANIGGITIPRNTILYATVNIGSHRAILTIPSIRLHDKIYNLPLIGLGDDGMPGIIINLDETAKDVDNTITQNVITQASAITSQLGIAGKIAGDVGRAIVNSSKRQNDIHVKFLDRQKINFTINE